MESKDDTIRLCLVTDISLIDAKLDGDQLNVTLDFDIDGVVLREKMHSIFVIIDNDKTSTHCTTN